jgi:hypothetical protein
MSLNDELSELISNLNALESPAIQEEVDEAIAFFGSFPSLETIDKVYEFYRKKRDEMERVDIPCVMASYGIKRTTMLDGTEVSLNTFYETKQGDKEKLAMWVEQNGFGDIIKDTLAFGKGEVNDDLMLFLKENGYAFTRDSSINSQTLKKVIKDHVASGGDLPPVEAVAVSIFESAVVKRPKEGFGAV